MSESDQGKDAVKAGPPQVDGPPLLTIGDLKAELGRWRDDAAVTFRCPLQEQEFRFYRFQAISPSVLEIDINQYPETPAVAAR